MKVRIFKPHNHAGTQFTPGPDGLVIDVPAHDAAFLLMQGATDAEPAIGAATEQTKPTAPPLRSRAQSSAR